MINITLLEGRITADPEIRYVGGENANANVNFTVAVNRNYKNAEGKYDADFIRCVAWGSSAEFISKNFKKGDPIIVRGNIRTGSYTNKSGSKVYTTDVYVDEAHFTIGGKNSGDVTKNTNNNANNRDFMNIPDTDAEEVPWDE